MTIGAREAKRALMQPEPPFNVITRGLPDVTEPNLVHHGERTYVFHVAVNPRFPAEDLDITIPRIIHEKGHHGVVLAKAPEQEEWLQAYLRGEGLAWRSSSQRAGDVERWLDLVLRMPGTVIVPGAPLFEDEWISND